MSYNPIESYGIIGDLRSVALVGMDGSIDWCCLPRFDSPSVFAKILDSKQGGYFQIAACADNGKNRQMYLPDTNVLVTRFLSAEGVGEVVDFMPVRRAEGGFTDEEGRHIVRIARAVRGDMHFRLALHPAFNYARTPHEVELCPGGAVFRAGRTIFVLSSSKELRRESDGLVAQFVLKQGESATFSLRHAEAAGCESLQQPIHGDVLLRETMNFWRNWMGKCRYQGRWREMVHRSALVLKLLSYQPTGAIVAAATTSLPEDMGGVRNWDYRYTWVRDAAFSVYALMRLGYTEEAAAFMKFMQARAQEEEKVGGPLNVMYGIDGRHDLTEFELDHLEGYCGSRPVRVGNGAASHLQLDIYGELMDSIYLYDKYGSPLSYEMWCTVERMLDWVSKNWNQPDQGIWEVRGERQHFTYSKLQCWVALDRGLRLSNKRSFPVNGSDWLRERDGIYRAIMHQSWNSDVSAFTQYFGSNAMDATALMMPLMLFISPTDPRMLSTIDRVQERLVSDSLVYRYRMEDAADDGLPGGEGTFSMCTFWLAEAMNRAGRTEEARFIFEKMLTYANHLGLYAEEIGPKGEALGNFPQAFTHLGLISAAFNLDRTLGSE